jgi:lysophospholipase L1-like esterase
MVEVSMKNRMAIPFSNPSAKWQVLRARVFPSFVVVVGLVAIGGGCSSPSGSSAGSQGGSSSAGTGGTTALGGARGAGGETVAGGTPSGAGATAAGGMAGSGGTTSVGDTPSAGGSTGSGGGPSTGGNASEIGMDAGRTTSDASKDVTTPDTARPADAVPDNRPVGASGGGAGSGTGGSSAGGSGVGGSGVGGGATGGSGGSSAGGTTGEIPLDPTLLSKCTGTNPINCAFAATNGNYNVTVELGSATAAATTRVLAETRRIELQPTNTAAGAYFRYTFTVNVRTEIHDGYGAPGNILNLSFDGAAPALHGVGFAAATVPTIFIAGDSTVCDWDPATYNPFTSYGATDVSGWGQELSQYLHAGIAVANYADSGETAGTFYTKFYPPEKAAMKQGDFLFVQFGHNDMKTDTAATYQANLTKYITDARAKNVVPVLITPVARESGANFNGFDQTMRDLATAQKVALIDLTNLALTYYGTLSSAAKTATFIDGTHFHEAGATQIANLVAQAMKGLNIGLESYVK